MYVGRLATVTKRITGTSTGEVMLGTPEGFKTLFAHSNTPDTEFTEGTTVVIVGSETEGLVVVQAPN
jgi:hypothetical protein